MSYNETVKSASKRQNIEVFSDSIPRRIRVKERNRLIRNGNARLFSFPGATSNQLLHYLDTNLDRFTESVILHIGINDILNDFLTSNTESLSKKW